MLQVLYISFASGVCSLYVPCIPAVSQTINFTLQSTLHGVDFGLVQNGVIFYDCLVSER